MRKTLKPAILIVSSTLFMSIGSHAASAQDSGQLTGMEQVAYCLSQMFAQPRDPQCYGAVEASNSTSLINSGDVPEQRAQECSDIFRSTVNCPPPQNECSSEKLC